MLFRQDFEKSSLIWLGYMWAFYESGMISLEAYEKIMSLIPNAHYSEEYMEMDTGKPVDEEHRKILADKLNESSGASAIR
jgi:hypothetical protein